MTITSKDYRCLKGAERIVRKMVDILVFGLRVVA